MQKIPNTFCPAKWDELFINFSTNYVYSCCKGKPQIFENGNYQQIIDQQKDNLINGIQDPSCQYCWSLENAGKPSDRTLVYLKNFDDDKFVNYQTNLITPSVVEVNLGNECNLQCMYCNPKFSSKWESDVSSKPYKTLTDRHHFLLSKYKHNDRIDQNLKFLKSTGNLHKLNIIGGEPLRNKHLWTILEEVENVEELHLVTNLMTTKEVIDRLFSYAHKFKKIVLGVSLDATGEIAEFVRHGLVYDDFISNLDYIIKNYNKNSSIIVLSLLTSLSVRDIANLRIAVKSFKEKKPDIFWRMSYCTSPITQSFETLPDSLKPALIAELDRIAVEDTNINVIPVLDNLKQSKFNANLYNELTVFIDEFSTRKNIKIPVKLLDAKTN